MSPASGVFAPAHRALSIGILLTITAVACEGMAVATILPSVAVDLGGLEAYGWAFSAFMLLSLVGATSAGEVADRRGPTLPALAGFGAFALGLVLSGAALAWPLLLLGRAVQGFGAGALGSVAYVGVGRGYPEALRPRLLALLSSAWIIPSLVGPALAGQVAEHASWRLVFFGLLPIVAVGAWTVLPSLRRLPPPPASPPTMVGSHESGRSRGTGRLILSLRLMAGIGLVLLAVGLQVVPAAVIVGALGLALALPALGALLPRGSFTLSHGLPAAVALRGLIAFGFFGSEAVIPLGLSTERGIAPSVVGIALTVGALAWVAASWIQDRAESAAHGSLERRAVRVFGGLLLLGAGIGVAGFAVVVPSLPVAAVIVAWALAGFGMGLAFPATTLTALGLAGSGKEGSASAALQVAETVGTATGTGAAGALFALAGHLQHPAANGLAWAFALSLGGILLALAAAARLAPGGAGPSSAPSPTAAPAAAPAASVTTSRPG